MSALLLAICLAQLDAGTVVVGTRPSQPGSVIGRGPELSAGAGVEHDPIRAAEQLAARPALGSSEVVLWGALPSESRFLVDGIEVPSLLHLGGYRSILAGPLVGRVELAPGAFRSDVGRALGGLVRVETAELQPGLHGSLSADVTNVGATVGFGDERVRAMVGADVGLLAPLAAPLLQGAARDRYPLPVSADAQAKASFVLTESDRLDVLALTSSDFSSQQVASDDPSLARGREQSLRFVRLGVTWRHGEGAAAVTVTPFVGLDWLGTTLHGAAGEASSSAQRLQTGLRARWQTTLDSTVSLEYGFDGVLTRGWYARLGPPSFPAREGDVVAFGEPISDLVASDSWRTTTVDAAAFFAAELSLGALSLQPGVRVSAVSSDVSRGTPRVASTPLAGVSSLEWLPEPRVSASVRLTPEVSLLGAFGLTHQAPDGAEQSAVFSSPVLPSARGLHAALGAASALGLVSLEVTGFLRTGWALAVRDPRATPGVTMALLAQGEARAGGAQVLVRQRAWHGLTSSLAYTLSRSERRDGAEASWRSSDFDQTHLLVAQVRQELAGWRFGLRGRWATGAPRTEVIGSYVDLRRGVYEPIFGTQNTVRLPDFLQFDADVARAFAVGRGSIEVFLEVLNFTNHRNVEEFVYDSTFSTRGALLGLPICGTLGLRGAW